MQYDFKSVEAKWQKRWADAKCFEAGKKPGRGKRYDLIEFPYPSGVGLHVGHTRPYTAMDVVARKQRMEGYDVLLPFGWDAFGLPCENFAIKNKIHPKTVTEQNVAHFKEQCGMMGYGFDWSREINTTDPEYYKWTQWIFLQMFKRGLAYKKMTTVNWCTRCLCVLANEEVVNGLCERCDAPVVQKEKEQWLLKITAYADRLLADLDTVDYADRIKAQQRHWIGKSFGAEVDFNTTAGDRLRVFTTRPDTLFGATYMVVAPEHPLLKRWAGKLRNNDELEAYKKAAAAKSDFERTELAKDKTGVMLSGVAAINPANGEEIPVFISDYVLLSYGTGAIMAVPGHDARDYEFAKKFNLPIVEVVAGGDIEKEAFVGCETGVMVNSGFLNGLSVEDAKRRITSWLADNGKGEQSVKFKLRDWIFSRQRYWGEPIPVVRCERCGYVAVPEEELPVVLPMVDSYEPTETGESPLAKIGSFVNTICPKCGGPAERETDTMPQWAGSSWYFLRYADPNNGGALASKEALAYWTPVDWYNGGMEHTTLHLLYSRFWHKFLYDIGAVPTAEPYKKRTSHGDVLGENGVRMSKSRGNAIALEDAAREYGADTLRLYIMFLGDFEKTIMWQNNAVRGCSRFIERVIGLGDKLKPGKEYSRQFETALHRTIKKVGDDIEGLKFNTAIASMMSLVNLFYDGGGANEAEYVTLLKLLNPFAPHIAEELYERFGRGLLAEAAWPEYDEGRIKEDTVEIAVQINGKMKATVSVPTDCADTDAADIAASEPKVKAALAGMEVVKTIVVKNKIVNLVVRAK